MALRADSYSSTSEVKAYTRHLLAGQSAFNSTTRPTGTDVEKFLDRASGVLNLALAQGGFQPSSVRGNSTAKLAADDWVTARATEYVELTQRGVGYSEGEGSRATYFRNITKSAEEFVRMNALGFVRLGVTQTYKKSAGLAFTGQDVQKNRADRSDSSMEQPFATRHQFDNTRAVNFNGSTNGVWP